jgi:hypothetical protein
MYLRDEPRFPPSSTEVAMNSSPGRTTNVPGIVGMAKAL